MKFTEKHLQRTGPRPMPNFLVTLRGEVHEVQQRLLCTCPKFLTLPGPSQARGTTHPGRTGLRRIWHVRSSLMHENQTITEGFLTPAAFAWSPPEPPQGTRSGGRPRRTPRTRRAARPCAPSGAWLGSSFACTRCRQRATHPCGCAGAGPGTSSR